jgi:hypothetical protein
MATSLTIIRPLMRLAFDSFDRSDFILDPDIKRNGEGTRCTEGGKEGQSLGRLHPAARAAFTCPT